MRIACPGCTKPLNLPDTLAGKAVQCSACSSKFRLPAARSSASPPPLPPKKPASPVTERSPKKVPARGGATAAPRRPARAFAEPEPPRARRAAPRHIEEDEDSPRYARRRRRYEEDDEDEEEEDADEEPTPRKRRKKKRRRTRVGFTWTRFNLGLLLVNFALFFIGLLLWLLIGSAGFLLPMLVQILIAVVAGIAGGIMFIVVAFLDDVIEGLLVLFIPIYAIVYLCKNPETQGWFCLSLVSWVCLFTAVGESAISQFGDRARQNAPAFQQAQFQPPLVQRPIQPPVQQPVQQPVQRPVAPPSPPVAGPVAPNVTGNPQLDKLLADLESEDRQRVLSATSDLFLMPMLPEHQPKVFAKLIAIAKAPFDLKRNYQRIAAEAVLRKWSTKNDIPALLELRKGSDPEGIDISRLLDIVEPFHDERTIPLAIEAMRLKVPKAKALAALRTMGSKPEPFVLPLLKESNPVLVLEAIYLLRDIGTSASIPALQPLVTGPVVRLRSAARAATKSIKLRAS